MKLALIPPVQWLESFTNMTKCQLMLPQMLRNSAYSFHYSSLCAKLTEFVILDNGAAEKDPFDAEALLLIARHFRVSEVVASDVLGDTAATTIATEHFLNKATELGYEGRIAIVLQGRELEFALNMVFRFIELNKGVTTVHIPRSLIQVGREWARLDLAAHIHNKYPYIDIHLLGASNLWPKEILEAARNYPFIRSMDTSMPFVCARNYFTIGQERAPHRDGDSSYFTDTYTRLQYDTARRNVERMLLWVDGIG
jgi:hypothetical protein